MRLNKLYLYLEHMNIAFIILHLCANVECVVCLVDEKMIGVLFVQCVFTVTQRLRGEQLVPR